MNRNIQTGGLLAACDTGVLFTDVAGRGTFLYPHFAVQAPKLLTNNLLWFINVSDSYIYYSNQNKNHALCRMGLDFEQEIILVDKPCYQVQLDKESLFYINEDDRFLYRCSITGTHESKIINEQVESFIIHDGIIIYSTSKGISTCNAEGSDRKTISAVKASQLFLVADKLAFSDKENNRKITLLDLKEGSEDWLHDIETISMNSDGRYLYCANRLTGGSILRLDPLNGKSIRICGEQVDFIHIIGDELIFYNNNAWYRLPLMGGQASKIVL